MSDFQKNSSNFEDLCLKIVKKLLGNSLNKIKKTQPSKDGGYDIDATIKYKNKQYSVLYNVPLVKTQMKKIIVTAKTLYSHPKNVSKIYAALHTDLAW